MESVGVLTEAEKEHFLTHGWLRIKGAFTQEQAENATRNLWRRLGMDPADKTTWSQLRTNLPPSGTVKVDAADFAPRAWAAVCELCGGEDRINAKCRMWSDAFIVNLGAPEYEGRTTEPRDLDNWHVDGDFFVHYLDSPEQGLLIIPLYTEVVPGGGGTFICPDAMPKVARWLHDHPEGVSPRMVPRGEPDFDKERNLEWFCNTAGDCEEFVEVTGDAGDVFLLHPLMLHSASLNPFRRVRIITNPPVALKEPFKFFRPDGDYSLVELTTLRALGKSKEDPLIDWEIKAPRQEVIPDRVRRWEEMKRDEARRLEAADQLSAGIVGP